jgi:GxxExxY protein
MGGKYTMDIEEIASKIVAAAMKVHTALGPGLLESAYQKCMEYELSRDGSKVECEVILPIISQDEEMQIGVFAQLECSAYEGRNQEDGQ